MGTVIRKIASYLFNNWSRIASWIKTAIKNITNGLIVDYIVSNYDRLVTALSHLSSDVLNAIARLLGL